MSVGFKPYSTNGSCHPTIDALLDLRREHALELDQVASVHIEASSATKAHVGWPYTPGSVTTAQMNLAYIVAVTLADGDAFVAQFTDERIVAPALVGFTPRVHVEAAADIDAEGDAGRHHTRIRVTLHDGRTFEDERHHARGSARQPMSEEEVRAKFRKLTAPLLGEDGSERLRAAVAALAGAGSVDGIVSLVSGAGVS
jgi:2-methylcitrate dehydratase PrpD